MRNSTLVIFLIISISSTLIAVSFAQNFTERYLPEGAIARFGKGYISDFVYSPDGRTLASGSRDGTIRLWDVHTGALIKTFTEQSGSRDNVVFSPDGTMLAGVGEDRKIYLWDVSSGELVKNIIPGRNHIYSVAFSPDGATLAAGDDHNEIRICDIATGQLLKTIQTQWGTSSLVYSPDGNILASCGTDIYFWDVNTAELMKTITGHNDDVYTLAFSPDWRTLASGGRGSTVILWDLTK